MVTYSVRAGHQIGRIKELLGKYKKKKDENKTGLGQKSTDKCMKLTTKLEGLVIWPQSLQNYCVFSVCYKHFNNNVSV